jgi:hypothetical protein
MPVPHVGVNDFYHDAFDIFRKKAVASNRLTQEDVTGSNEELLQALKDGLVKTPCFAKHGVFWGS